MIRRPVVVLRADASAQIGFGHVKRCLSLAQALSQRGATCVLLCRELGVDTISPARAAGIEVRTLPRPVKDRPLPCSDGAPHLDHARWLHVTQAQDAQDTIASVADLRVDWVVVDHYGIDARWHRELADALDCRIAAIDDLADRALAVEVLIDHNHAHDHRAKYAHRLGRHTRLLVGPAHALLAPVYADAARHAGGPEVRSIGIFMGGVDAPGLALLALQACEQAGFDGEVEIAATSACPHLAALEGAASRRPRTHVSLDRPDLAAFFARHDLQIGAGGGATWERCCIGAPTLALVTADNQHQVLAPLAGLGVLEVVDPGPRPTAVALAASIRALIADPARRERLSQASRRLVDGRGASRVAAKLVEASTVAKSVSTP